MRCYGITKGFTNCNDCVLAEEFIKGVEFTIDGIMWEGEHQSLAISEKKHYEEYPNVASELMFSYSKYDLNRLAEQHNALLKKMELPFGLTHAEYIYSEERDAFYLVEVAARGGGTNISGKIVSAVSGVDNMSFLIKAASGEKISSSELQKKHNKYAVLKFFDFRPGIVKKVHGTEFLKESKNIIDYRLNFENGEKIGLPADDSKRPGHYIAVADTYEELKDVIGKVGSNVFAEYEA